MTEHTQTRIQQCFRRGVQTYHSQASVQLQIAEQLVTMLSRKSGAPRRFDRIFEFGCGTGHLSQALSAAHAIGDFYANDLVAEVAPQVQEALNGRYDRMQFLPGPVQDVVVPQDLDLVCSASTIQWLPDLQRVLGKLTDALRPEGWMALSGFGRGHFHELVVLGSQSGAPNYLDGPALEAILPANMDVLSVRQDPVVLYFDQATDILRHLRATGVNGQAAQTWSRRRLQRFANDYAARFGQSGRLPLTYNPVWLIARKKAD